MAVSPQTEPSSAPKSPLRRWAPVLALVVILVLFFALGLNRYLSFATLRDNRAAIAEVVAAHAVVAALLFIAAYLVVVAASLPAGSVLTVLGGFLFGTWLGTLLVLIGATTGATVLFLAARNALGDSVQRRMGALGERLARDLAQNALSYLLVLRLVPLFPFWLVNLVAAAANIPLVTYVIGTFLGIIPASFVYASIGSGLGAVFDRGETPDLKVILSPDVLVPLIGLAVLALIPVVYRRIKRA